MGKINDLDDVLGKVTEAPLYEGEQGRAPRAIVDGGAGTYITPDGAPDAALFEQVYQKLRRLRAAPT